MAGVPQRPRALYRSGSKESYNWTSVNGNWRLSFLVVEGACGTGRLLGLPFRGGMRGILNPAHLGADLAGILAEWHEPHRCRQGIERDTTVSIVLISVQK